MALVVFLKGINVGGHRRFRPSALAKELKHFDVVNIGAAGIFVVRNAVTKTNLRAEIMNRVPFEVDVMICSGSEVIRLISDNPLESYAAGRDIIPFVSVMATNKKPLSTFPLALPSNGDWCLKVLECQERFVLGLYRRQMKAITYLGQLEKILGVPLTTRSWNTILKIGGVLRPYAG